MDLGSGAADGEDFQQARERHETCGSCRNPTAGNRPLAEAGFDPEISGSALAVAGEMSTEPTHASSTSCFVKTARSQPHIYKQSFKLAPDRGQDASLPNCIISCDCSSRNG